MTKGYRNGVRIVRFPGGRVARFHKPGTATYARGVAKKKRMGKLLAKRFGIKKKRRSNPGKYARRSREPVQWRCGMVVRRSDHQLRENLGVGQALGVVVELFVHTGDNGTVEVWPVVHWQGQPTDSITSPLNATPVSPSEVAALYERAGYP